MNKLNMKFDVCIQNPPYQMRYNADNPTAKDIYPDFVKWGVDNSDVTIALTPSRWFGKKNLESYRDWLIASDQGLRYIWHTDNDAVFGNGVSVKGGVSFVVLDKNYTGPTYVSFLHDYTDLAVNDARILNSRSIIAESILDKVSLSESLNTIFAAKSYFKVKTNDKRFLDTNQKDTVKCFVSRRKGFEKYILKSIVENRPNFLKWKVVHRAADGKGNDYTSYSFIAKPTEVVSESYGHYAFDSEVECQNYQTYFNTNLYRFLMKCGKTKQDLLSAAYRYIPLVSFDEAWDDEKLAHKFSLTEEEVAYINEQVG
jgi:hypothetical protein